MKSYCTQNNGDCGTCSLVNYNRDCRNNRVEPSFEEDLDELMGAVEARDRAEAERRLDACCEHISELPPDIRERIEAIVQRPLGEAWRDGFGELAADLKTIFDSAGVAPPWEEEK